MKERLLTILAAVALLVSIQRPAAPSVLFRAAVPTVVATADCQGGGQCSN